MLQGGDIDVAIGVRGGEAPEIKPLIPKHGVLLSNTSSTPGSIPLAIS